ncbi:MAG: hypothetical protein M1832_002908 [Thelocarpon impressellum]|nr:MAG: hypothetical protein M1832_002908 [Thelocarpon impressellum]
MHLFGSLVQILLASAAISPVVNAAPQGCLGCFPSVQGCVDPCPSLPGLKKEEVESLKDLWLRSFHTDGSGSFPEASPGKRWYQAVCCGAWCFDVRSKPGPEATWGWADFEKSYNKLLAELEKGRHSTLCMGAVNTKRDQDLRLAVYLSGSSYTFRGKTWKSKLGETCAGAPAWRGEF